MYDFFDCICKMRYNTSGKINRPEHTFLNDVLQNSDILHTPAPALCYKILFIASIELTSGIVI